VTHTECGRVTNGCWFLASTTVLQEPLLKAVEIHHIIHDFPPRLLLTLCVPYNALRASANGEAFTRLHPHKQFMIGKVDYHMHSRSPSSMYRLFSSHQHGRFDFSPLKSYYVHMIFRPRCFPIFLTPRWRLFSRRPPVKFFLPLDAPFFIRGGRGGYTHTVELEWVIGDTVSPTKYSMMRIWRIICDTLYLYVIRCM